MKKIICLCICFLCLVCMPINVSASETYRTEKLTRSNSDYKEIMLLLPDIKRDLHETLEMEGTHASVDSLEISLEVASKIYIDTPVFSLNSSEPEQVSHSIKSSEYVWVIPVYVGQDTYFVNIARGMPLDESVAPYLSEEQIATIREEEGKWMISGVQRYENAHIDYNEIINKALADIAYDQDVTVLLCGGLEQIQNPAAIIMDDSGAEWIVPLFNLPIQGSDEQIAKLKPDEAKENDEIYKYEELRDSIMDMGQEEREISGGIGIVLKPEKETNRSAIFFIIAIVAIVAGMVIKRKKLLKGKKVITFMLMVSFCFFLSGCEGNNELVGFQNFRSQEIQRAEVSLYTVPNHTDTVELSRTDIEKIVTILENAEICETGGEELTEVAGGTPILEFVFENGEKKEFFCFQEWIAYEGKSYKVGEEVCKQLDEISYGLLPENNMY